MSNLTNNITIEDTRLSNSQKIGEHLQNNRVIMGQELQFGGVLGENSIPGDGITFSGPSNVYSSQIGLNKVSETSEKAKKVTKRMKHIISLREILDEEIVKMDTEMEKENEIDNTGLILPETDNNVNYSYHKSKVNNSHKSKKRDRIIKRAKKKYQTLRFILGEQLSLNKKQDMNNPDEIYDIPRSILGDMLPLGDSPMGYNSFPGPDITYTPSNPINNPMVGLGCLNSQLITDIVPIKQQWPSHQTPYNFATGSSNTFGSVRANSIVTGNGQSNTTTDGVSNHSTTGVGTTFDSSVYLSSDVSLYGISSDTAAATYSPVNLSQEGMLWTLWSLVRNNDEQHPHLTYFDEIYFGTAKRSKYPLGQLGYFINNKIMGCTPFGATNTNSSGYSSTPKTFPSGSGIKNNAPGIIPGTESINQALLTVTGQQVAIIVVKVSEQIARIDNPGSGLAADNEFILVGYDGWAVINMTSNPMGPMAAQTYISPQTITGTLTRENLQVILPPNFPNTLFYKNDSYRIPVTTNTGLFMGTTFTNGLS